MRTYGRAPTHGPFQLTDHSFLAFGSDPEFTTAALGFLADGLLAGQRLIYLAGRTAALADLGGLGDLDELLDRGVLQVDPLDEAFDLSGPTDVETQLASFDESVRKAVADGFAGLRVVADATELVAEPGCRTGHLRWEHRAEQYMSSGQPLAALCCYDGRVLPPDLLADLAALHPAVHGTGPLPKLRIHFVGDRLVLTGVLDVFTSPRVHQVLSGSHLQGTDVVLDLARLDFVDARGASTLARWGMELVAVGGSLRIEGASRLLCMVWRLLGYHHVEGVELVGERP